MHTIPINLYSFEELAPAVQQQVVERERYINVDDSFWYEPIIEYWTDKLHQRGFEEAKILFSGFGSQGDGACFTATVNIDQFLQAHKLQRHFRKVFTAAKQSLLWVSIRHSYRYCFATSTDVEIQYDGDQEIDDELERFERVIQEEREKLGNAIYRSLEEEFAYQMSDEVVEETLVATAYDYLSDGRRFTVPVPA